MECYFGSIFCVPPFVYSLGDVGVVRSNWAAHMTDYSVYGDAYFLIGYAMCGFLSLLCLTLAAFAFVPAIARKRAPTVLQTRASGVLLWFCGFWASCALAILSAFDYAALWYVIVASVVTWSVLCVPIAFAWSPSLPQPFFRRNTGTWHRRGSGDSAMERNVVRTPKSDESDEELRRLTPPAGSAGPLAGAVPPVELRRRNPNVTNGSVGTSPPANVTPPHPNPSSRISLPAQLAAMDGGTIRYSKELIEELAPQIKLAKDDLRTRWPHYVLVLVIGFGVSSALIVLTYGACICSQPNEITSWATRRSSSKKICQTNAVCHSYALLGKDCTELVAVGHVVVESGVRVVSADVQYQCSHPLTPSCMDPVREATRTTIAVSNVFPMDEIEEDTRFVVAMAIPVVGGTLYNVSFRVLLSNGNSLSSLTNPLIVQSPSCLTPDTQDGFVFMGGGDYRVKGDGELMLRQGMRQSSEAQFYYIGGDLAYANNMRRCYQRWDLFFLETIRAITRELDGATLPILAAVGNHEGGGYLQASTRSERESRIVFYARYFPHYLSSATPAVENNATVGDTADWTLTFHSHAVGSTLGLIILDSDIIVAAKDQTEFVTIASRDLMRYLDAQSVAKGISLNQSRRLVFIYHNPAYPSTRDSDNAVSTSILETFVPLIESVNNWTSADGYQAPLNSPLMHTIACVLEHHDHAYKRTVPILRNSAQTVGGGGIIYLGDGALGVSARAASDTSLWYIERAQQVNYVLRLTTFLNGTLSVAAFQPDGSFLDALRT